MATKNQRTLRPTPQAHLSLAIAGILLSTLIVTLTGAWAEARSPHPAGRHITVKPLGIPVAAELMWQLRRVDGVRDVVAVFQGNLAADDIEGTGWDTAQIYVNQTDASGLAFLPPDPTLRLKRGRLPTIHSLAEALLGHEMAQALRLEIGDSVMIQQRSFTVVGIWSPSAHLPGNFVQVTSAAAQALGALPSQTIHHLAVLPVSEQDITYTAARIWRKIPDVEVVSPEWELAQAGHERTILMLILSAAATLCVLLNVPLLADLGRHGGQQPVVVSLLSGLGGLLLGWGIGRLANLYAGRTLALTPLQMSPGLAIAALTLASFTGLIASALRTRWPGLIRFVTAVFVLFLCSAMLVTVGSVNESLSFAITEAQRTAADWVTVPGVRADAAFLRDVERLPGIRGHTIEAYGGLADEDEERWLGPPAPSGLVYGVEYLGGEGTLTIPYRLGYWDGRPLDPEKGSEAVVGYDLAQEQRLAIGDTITVRDAPFTVVGIRNQVPDAAGGDANHRIDVSIEALRRVLHDPFAEGEITLLMPPARSQEEKLVYLQEAVSRLNVGQILTVDDRVAEIARSYPAVWTVTPATPEEVIRHARATYGGILVLCTVLLLGLSALAVTGAMADRLVQDEMRVGLLKALGSDEGRLLGDYLQMAALLGIEGAIPGLLAGWKITNLLNQVAPDRTPGLLFTPQLGAAVFFLIALTAMVASIAPVSRALRQSATWTLYSTSLMEPASPSPDGVEASFP